MKKLGGEIFYGGKAGGGIVEGEDLGVGVGSERHSGGADLAEADAVAPAVTGDMPELRVGSIFADIETRRIEMRRGEESADHQLFADIENGGGTV